MPVRSPMTTFAFRLPPGADLKQVLGSFAEHEGLKAAIVLTCVGSLTTVALRYANQADAVTRTGHFEILSLVGTLTATGAHLHLCVADRDGVAFGGHLMPGCVVYTTAEVVVSELTAVEFGRELDATSGYRELVVAGRREPDA